MKSPALLAAALLAVCSSAAAIADEDDLSVPGDNPLQYCGKPDDYILSIGNIDVDPNPPAAYVSSSKL